MEITNSKDQKCSSNYGTNILCNIMCEVLKNLTLENEYNKFIIGRKLMFNP